MTLVDPKANLGFGRANNLAYANSKGRWVLLLNPDTVVLDRAIEKLLKFADAHPEAAAVGGRTLKRDGKTLERSCCWGSPGMWPLFCKAFGLHIIFKNSPIFNREAMDYWQRDSVREVGVITGCCLMIRRDVYEATGGFDDRFFMYAEETDLCWRMKEKGKLLFCPEAQIIHLVGESAKKATSNRLFHINRALLKLFRKHHGTAYMVLANFWMTLFYAVRVPLLAIYNGADIVRGDPHPWLFTTTASLREEVRAMLRNLATVSTRKVAVAYQANELGRYMLPQVEALAAAEGDGRVVARR